MATQPIRFAMAALMLLVLAAAALAIPIPYGIDGTIYDLDGATKAKGVNFTITHLGTGQKITGFTKSGEYSLALNWQSGSIRINASNQEHSSNRTVVLNGVLHKVDLLLNMSMTNKKPQILSSPIVSVLEDQSYNYPVDAYDPNDDEMNYSVQGPAGMTISSQGLVNWVPGNDDVGLHNIVVFITDGLLIANQTYQLNVIFVNDAPQITSEPLRIALTEELYEYNITSVDIDSFPTLSLLQGPTGMNLSGNTIRWIPSREQTGANLVRIEASDGELSAEQTFNVLVNATNRKPTIHSSPQTRTSQAASYEYEIEAQDLDNDSLYFMLKNGPPGMSLLTSKILWNDTNKSVGIVSITVNVSDGLLSDEQTFILEVEKTNYTPQIISTPTTEISEGENYAYQVLAQDKNNDPLTYSVNGPLTMLISPTGLITWTPTSQESFASVLVKVSDGTEAVEQNFTISIIKAGTLGVEKMLLVEENQEAAEITAKENWKDETAEINFLEAKPRGIDSVDAKVYKYILAKSSKPMKISFGVPLSWLDEHSIKAEDIVLKGYGKGWVDLNTEIKGNDSENVYYEASGRMKYYAIATRHRASVPLPKSSSIRNPYRITGKLYYNEQEFPSVNYSIKNLNSKEEFSGRSISGGYYALVYGNRGDVVSFKSQGSTYKFELDTEPGTELVIHFKIIPEHQILNYSLLAMATLSLGLIVFFIVRLKKRLVK